MTARFYISFGTEDAFLGATVVEGVDAENALQNATRAGLNPGGEAMILFITSEEAGAFDMQAIFNRLATLEEMKSLGGNASRSISDDALAKLQRDATIIEQPE